MSARVQNGNGIEGTERRPLGTVVASTVDGFRALARAHVDLAKLEVSEAASTRAQGVGMFGAAGVLAIYALGFVAAALALVLPVWAAILIVAAVLLLVAGALVLIARRALRTAPAPAERTREALKEDARWARRQLTR